MKNFALAVLASATAAMNTERLDYVNYTARYNKVYGEVDEWKRRYEVWKYNTEQINEHNATESNFKLGHN